MKKVTENKILKVHESAAFVKQSLDFLKEKESFKLQVKGLIGSSKTLYASNLWKNLKRNIVFVFEDPEVAAYALNELEDSFGKEHVLYFPASYRRPYEIEATNNANVVLRTEVLSKIVQSNQPRIIVTLSNALTEKVVTKKAFKAHTLELKTGENISVDFLNETLFAYEFRRVDFVTEPGEFSVRGGIIDIFSYGDEKPYRVSFFGNEIDSIRQFEVETQLSIGKVDKFTLVANIENKTIAEVRQNFMSYLPKKTVYLFDSLHVSTQNIDDNFNKAIQSFTNLTGELKHLKPEELFINKIEWLNTIEDRQVVELSSQTYFSPQLSLEANQSPQPSFHKKFDLLLDTLQEQTEKAYINYIFCSSEKQIERLKDIFKDIGRKVSVDFVLNGMHEGFIDNDLKIACFTDHQIFERYHRFRLRNSFTKKESITLKELTNLQVGDFVTHIDHGIGKFAGLKKIDVNGTSQEAIKLIYKDNDTLYVSIHSLHKISKFTSKEGSEPKVNKLGSPAWKSLKNKTKKKVKEVAFDLIKLYAKRRMEEGFQFSPDSYLQNELEASFMYEDTPDQITATEDVKRDMESPQSMDRLICGDVGFGKTEVAIRAAFKAATDGKQVAILVPTTILAFQHYKTFKERLEEFPVRIEYLNRFKSTKQKNEILKDLADGKIDIIIGTHQIVNAKIKYKDLGLLIVDEEHKFGVSVKDKLKTLRAHLDTLTLTATPIPRTLQFSLMAARDLSIIKTPPPNRQPVETHLIGMNEEQIRDAVFYEIQRGGQVFVIYNRIAGLKDMAGMIQRLVPEAKINIGHGQMDGKKLESTVLDFMAGKFDVLVSTTIVESGVDVPNANTMLIVDAHNFGLADLHQMRGRVGRSNRKAFCYLITPPLASLTSEARKRLQAIEQFSDLGAGFNIAMKDLEIRGAGNLLGAEQSGFMAEMGFDTYQKILNEAIKELKHTDDFKDLFNDENKDKEEIFVSEFNFDTDLELLIPDLYVNNVEERMMLYNELTIIDNEKDLAKFSKKIIDRFGEYPEEVEQLLKSIELKWIAKNLGFEKIVLKQNICLAYFVGNPKSPFYQSDTFGKLIQLLQTNPSFGRIKEKKRRGEDIPSLVFRMEKVFSIDEALNRFKAMEEKVLKA